MAILCCCGQLRSRKRPHHEEDADLPVPPPPAKLPAPVFHPSAISPGSTLARSSLTNPLPGAATDASVHLGELVVEESDEDDVDEDPAHDSRNRSTSTLLAVKSRIRRHLSQDSLQRQSETEEQIAHRAEVKRLMRKRIQEELQSEADNVPSRSSTPQQHGTGTATLPGNGPRDTIEFTVDENHKSKEMTPTRAARVMEIDELEGRPKSQASPRMSSTRSFENENRRPTSWAASEPDWIDADSRASHIECHLGIRERSSLPDMPNSPVLIPVRGSACHDASSLASWRLSLSADKLADLFTPDKKLTLFRPIANTPATRSTVDLRDDVSLERPSSKSSPLGIRDSNTRQRPHSRQPSLDSTLHSQIPPSKSLIRDESPVGLWLRAQSMPFRTSTTSQPQSEIGVEEHHCLCTTSIHGESEDHFAETPTKPSRLRHADTNQHSSLPCSPSESRNSAGRTGQPLETALRPIHKDRESVHAVEVQPDSLYAICSAMPSGPRLFSPGPDILQPSGMLPAANDTHTQTDGTIPSHPHRRGIGGLRLASFKWSGLAGRSQDSHETNRSMTPPSGGPTTCFSNLDPRRATMEAGSETSSFLRREAELQNVEERFRNSHLRKGTFNPVESKFREIFDHDGDQSSNNRVSLLSKLHLSVPKRGRIAIIETLDGNSSRPALAGTCTLHTPALADKTSAQAGLDCAHLQVPDVLNGKGRAKANNASHTLAISSGKSRRLRGFSSSRDGDDTAELWKRAVRAESASRSPRGSVSSNLPAISLSPAVSNNGQMPQVPQPSGAESLSSSGSGMHSPLCKAHPDLGGEASVREALRRSTTILEEWAHQIETQERECQERVERAPASCSHYKMMNMPPASWAKFPSYNRDERNGAAGVGDKVKLRDFAVKNISASGNIARTTDRLDDGPPVQKGIARTVSDKFSQTFKSRLSKLIPGRSRTPSRDRSIRGERRSSIQIAGDLEYPELEILSTAGGYRELRALEYEIHEMKGVMDTKTCSTHKNSATPPFKSSLAEKVVIAMQQHDGCSEPGLSQASDAGSFVEEKASFVQIRSPETPALQIRYPDTIRAKESTGSTVERYATPLSHLSSNGNEASGSDNPDAVIKLLPSAHSSSSANSAKSLRRRASLHAAPGVEACALSTHTWQSRDDPRRRSVPALTARSSG